MAEESMVLGGIQTLREMGFFDFFLPFLLFFAIVYGALQKTQVFGEDRKDINAIISLVIALITATTGWVLKGVIGFLPWVGFLALVIVSFLMLAAMVAGGSVEELFKTPHLKAIGIIIVAVVIFIAVFYSLGFDKAFSSDGSGKLFGLGEADIALILIGIIGLAVFAVIMKSGGPSSGGKGG